MSVRQVFPNSGPAPGAAKLAAFVLAALCGLGSSVPVATAQIAPQIDNGRVCQTIRQCRFQRGGVYRGCISAYSCRTCRFVRTRCDIAGDGSERRSCRRLVCSWGAVS